MTEMPTHRFVLCRMSQLDHLYMVGQNKSRKNNGTRQHDEIRKSSSSVFKLETQVTVWFRMYGTSATLSNQQSNRILHFIAILLITLLLHSLTISLIH